jgi:hypothetical protein
VFYKFTYTIGPKIISGVLAWSEDKQVWHECGKHFFQAQHWPEWVKRQKAAGVIFEEGEVAVWDSIEKLEPSSCESDPPTAKEAARSPEAKVSLNKGIGRCFVTLHESNEARRYAPNLGLTDHEHVVEYASKFPEQADYKGFDGLTRMVMRNWCWLKPDMPREERLLQNLGIIGRTKFTRKNSRTGKDNIVFNFIQPPSIDQIKQMYEWAEKPDRKRRHREL